MGPPVARRALVATLVSVGVGLPSYALQPAAALAKTVTVRPAADGYTRSDRPRSHHGKSTRLIVKGSHPRQHSFLRFTVPVPKGQVVTKATLRLYTRSRIGKRGVSLRSAAAGAWRERRLTWRNEPGIGSTVVARASGRRKGRWLSLRATKLVTHAGRFTFALTTRGRKALSFGSREWKRAKRPRLVVETAPGSGFGTPPSSSRYAIRGVFSRDFSATGFDDEAAIGFSTIDSDPDADQMNALAARGLKGMIWLGGYNNTTCSFYESDVWVTSHVQAIAGNPGVGAYFIDDEPNPILCPAAGDQMKARSDLVKSIDPGPPTFIVQNHPERLHFFAGKVDILGLNNYPCSDADGCEFDKIEEQAAEAERLGVRYWGVIQAFGGSSGYRLPTPAEVHEQFVRWRRTRMEGYLVFAWRYPPEDPSVWLANHPEQQSQLAIENAH